VQTKIQSLGWGVVANVVNDGSGVNGYHLALTATNSGRAGRVVIDGCATSLTTQNLVEGPDAAVFLGGDGSSGQSLLVTSSTNQLTGIIPGVTVDLNSASSSPVTLSVTRDPSSVSKQLQTFTDTFNGLVDKLNTLTQWDTNSNTGGLLLGDATTATVQERMYSVFQSVVSGAGQYKLLADVGLKLTDGAKITFDPDKFNSPFAYDPTAVKNLFSQVQTGLGAVIDQSMTALVDPVSGVITQENSTLDNQVSGFHDQINNLNDILAAKRNRLQDQFNNMETILAGLQSQQAALGSLTSITPVSTSSSTKKTG
jgi:flagellar hook-associated protein 2